MRAPLFREPVKVLGSQTFPQHLQNHQFDELQQVLNRGGKYLERLRKHGELVLKVCREHLLGVLVDSQTVHWCILT